MAESSISPPTMFPTAYVDRLFDRLAAMYGKHWLEQWAGVPMADVKDTWQEVLAGVTGQQVAEALKACGKFPPTLPEFVALCKSAPITAAHRPYLSAPKTKWDDIDSRVRAEIEKFKNRGAKRDPKDWARAILERHDKGEPLLPIQIQFAREALGIAA